METEEIAICATRAELVAAYTKWITEVREDPSAFSSNEEMASTPAAERAEDSVTTLLSYLDDVVS